MTHNGVHAGRHAPFFVRKCFYAAGLRSVVGTFVGSAGFPPVSDEVAGEPSGEAAGVVAASGVAVGFAFSRDALMASNSTRDVYLLSEE